MLKLVLSTHSEAYEKGKALRDAFQSLLGTGVSNSDGPYLSTRRPTYPLTYIVRCAGDMWK